MAKPEPGEVTSRKYRDGDLIYWEAEANWKGYEGFSQRPFLTRYGAQSSAIRNAKREWKKNRDLQESEKTTSIYYFQEGRIVHLLGFLFTLAVIGGGVTLIALT